MIRQHRWTIIIMALLLGACGGAQQGTGPTAASTAERIPTAAPTATSIPTAEPTAQLILPPTNPPAAGSQPATDTQAISVFRAEPTAVPPAAQPTPPPARPQASGPTRLIIEDIGVDYKPVAVGLDKNRVPIVPNHDVGWYNLSFGPGQGENIVLWGHVLRFRNAPNIPAPFAHVKDLKPGASVVLYDRAGKAHNYKITQQVWATPDQVEYILPQGKEMVTMVSCIGDKVIQGGEVVDESHRLITIAEPA